MGDIPENRVDTLSGFPMISAVAAILAGSPGPFPGMP